MESCSQPAPLFKLKQFDNVKSRLRKDLSQCNISSQEEDRGEHDVQEDGEEMNLEDFEAAVERLKQQHGNQAPATKKKASFEKDVVGCPVYLQKIKAKLDEEKSRVEAQRSALSVPAGYRVLPEEEVTDTLEALRRKRADLEKEFQKLPLNIQTDSQKRRQKAVLNKIEESDRAIKIFSQPNVMVEM